MDFGAFSVLTLEIRVLEWQADGRLLTIGQTCRKAVREILESLITLVYKMFKDKRGVDQVIELLIKR